MKTTPLLTVILFVLTCTGFSCDGKPTAAQQSTLDTEVSARVIVVLSDYEKMRAALAQDRHSDVAGIATELDTSVKAAAQGAPAKVADRLNEMAKAALTMAPEKNTETQRKVFGDLSRAAVSLLLDHPSLTKGRHIFHCPMAQGYPKWIQTDGEMKNPYMGKRMLRCGTKSEWKL